MSATDEVSANAGSVFITGANGFIGRSLAARYRACGWRVSGIDFAAQPDWGVIAADLTQPDTWLGALVGVDLVIHAAAIVSNTATLEKAWQVNVKATAELLAHSAAAGVRRLVYLSSVAAYGFDFQQTAHEDDPLCPMGNTYVDTKIAAEHCVLASHARGDIDCTIIRPTDVYGPGSRPWVILPLEMLKTGKFLLPAHGRGLFSPVYVDDLVEGILLASTRAEGRGQIFNIGAGTAPTCAEFFGHHARMLGQTSLRSVSTTTARMLAGTVGTLTRYFGGETELGRGTIDMLSRKAGYSIEKAGRLLDYQPAVDLDEGMRRTRDWALQAGLVSGVIR